MNTQDLINACMTDWQAYTQHAFVKQLADGSLDKQAYLDYLQQDYLFLKHYARAYALLIFKSATLAEMRQPLPGLNALIDSEMNHHIAYCKAQGLDVDEMENIPESTGTVAYTRYVLDTGIASDRVALMTALAPCAIGYGEIGQRIAHLKGVSHHPYQDWISVYASDEFQHSAIQTKKRLDDAMQDISKESATGQALIRIFATATRMEAAFWQQSLNKIYRG